MKQYHDLIHKILNEGKVVPDRTGTGTRKIFGHQMRFNLQDGFPLVTTKATHFKSVLVELLWMLRGDTNLKFLHEHGVKIWDEWRKPWSKRRTLVRVQRVVKDYVPAPEGGYTHPVTVGLDQRLVGTWRHMMSRCYDTNSHNYRSYGAKGVSVAERWHDVSVFCEDVKHLPHWWYKQADWNSFELDKDYYGAMQYGPETCIWLHRDENVPTSWLWVKSPEGDEEVFEGYSEASKATGISRSSLHRFVTEGIPGTLKGRNKAMAGWQFGLCESDDLLIRRALIPDGDLGPVYGSQWRNFNGVDQLSELLDGLSNNPFGRRHVVSAWNSGSLQDMALPPCHALFQFDVSPNPGAGPDLLSCQLYQRSADVFLGVPFNVASYSLLTMFLAHKLGLGLGEFIWTGGDCHLYSNHAEQVQELIKRDPLPLPTVSFSHGRSRPLDRIDVSDVQLHNYHHMGAIKAPVAI